MAIKLPDPGNGIPEQKTGNDEWTNMKIVRDNFADQSNAASRLVGTASNNIADNKVVASVVRSDTASSEFQTDSPDTFAVGSYNYLSITSLSEHGFPDTGSSVGYNIMTIDGNTMFGAQRIPTQIAFPSNGMGGSGAQRNAGFMFYRSKSAYQGWSDWRAFGDNIMNYRRTTGSAPNLVVEPDGTLKRSSSSAKYKDVITKLELDNDLYQKAMQVSPIVYRSKSDGDPKNWHYMSFLAEEIGELDPSLTQWLITTHDDEGNELDEPTKEAEGINLNAICAVLHATNIYQDKKLKKLEQRLTALESNNEPVI